MKKTKLLLGNNQDLLKTLPDNSIDSVITDPPYGISFMLKKWDYDVPSVDFWKEVFRVLKPGGHILSFGGTRTFHRMVVNIEDAGFEIRDTINWIYGSGFPKNHNVSVYMDKIILNGKTREKKRIGIGNLNGQFAESVKDFVSQSKQHQVQTDEAKKWDGWGTQLKPSTELICLARKPLTEESIVKNVMKWGVGAINIDDSRIGDDSNGRFPANTILDEVAAEMLDKQSGISKSTPQKETIRKKPLLDKETTSKKDIWADGAIKSGHNHNDSGGASRFFYVAKVSKAERNMGLDDLEDKVIEGRDKGQDERSVAFKKRPTPTKNIHPTVKPINLMSYLCKLITPKGGIVLDPFMGSGSTGIAALLNDFRFIGMEMTDEYFTIAEKRIEHFEDYRKFLK